MKANEYFDFIKLNTKYPDFKVFKVNAKSNCEVGIIKYEPYLMFADVSYKN